MNHEHFRLALVKICYCADFLASRLQLFGDLRREELVFDRRKAPHLQNIDPAVIAELTGFRLDLEDALHKSVDVVTIEDLPPRLSASIHKDEVMIFDAA